MIRSSKSLLGLSLIACFAASQANACAISAWDAVVVAGSGSVGVVAADAVAVQAGNPRYSGSCALKITGASKFVQNTIATPRSTYKARFYVRKDLTGSGSEVFKATDAAGTANVITVTYTGTTFSFNVAGAATQPASVTVPSGTAWYSVTLDWTNAGAFTATVVGAGGVASTPATATATVATALTIGKARLGNTNAAAAGSYFFDEFDSRTTAVPPRLVRGDANGNGTVTVTDAIQVFNEAGGSSFAVGQPDANENGSVTTADAIVTFNIANQ
jgi:hypothetical protein